MQVVASVLIRQTSFWYTCLAAASYPVVERKFKFPCCHNQLELLWSIIFMRAISLNCMKFGLDTMVFGFHDMLKVKSIQLKIDYIISLSGLSPWNSWVPFKKKMFESFLCIYFGYQPGYQLIKKIILNYHWT